MTRYTRRQLYAIVSDVASYASFVPFCTHSRVLRPLGPAPTPATPNAQEMEAELTVAFLAFTERYMSRVTCVPCESVKVCPSFYFLLLYSKKQNLFFFKRKMLLTFVELGTDFFFLFSLFFFWVWWDRRLRHRPHLCSRPSRRRGVFNRRLRTRIMLLPRSDDLRAPERISRWTMSVRRFSRLTSRLRLRTLFMRRFLVVFLARCRR
jgi:hypothetical protein